jgi:hypothetical protein
MGPAPGLHAGDVDGAFEDIVVLGFAEPAALAGRLAGRATGRLTAITLALDIARVGNEKPLAVPALTSRASRHDPASPERESKRSGVGKNTRSREEKNRKKRKKRRMRKGGMGSKAVNEDGVPATFSYRQIQCTFRSPVTLAVYPSRQAMLEMMQLDGTQEISMHRAAGLAGQLNIETAGFSGQWLDGGSP